MIRSRFVTGWLFLAAGIVALLLGWPRGARILMLLGFALRGSRPKECPQTRTWWEGLSDAAFYVWFSLAFTGLGFESRQIPYEPLLSAVLLPLIFARLLWADGRWLKWQREHRAASPANS